MLSVVADLTGRFADREFLVAPAGTPGTLTYEDLWNASAALAERLHAEGVGRGDLVVTLLDSGPEYVVTAFALMLLGAALVPLHPAAAPAEVATICGHARPRLAVLEREDRRSGLDAVAVRSVVFDREVFEARGTAAPRGRAELRDDDLVVVLYTSGSTGRPKGVCLAAGPVRENFLAYGRAMRFGESTRFLQVMPVHHADGWNFTLLVPFLHGASVVLTEPFGPRVCATFDRLLRAHRPNVLVAIPSILSALLAFAERYGDPTGLDYAISSSEPLHARLKGEFEARFATRVCDLYGLTETQIVTYYSPELVWKPGSVGVPQDGVELRIGAGDEIQIRSPYLFAGYLRDEDATRACYVDGWFRTGDRGHVDGDGYVFLRGRAGDAVRRDGRSIHPAEIDAVLAGHPRVVESATIGVRDEEVWSFVVAAGGAEAEPELRAHLEERLTSDSRPERLAFLAQLPRNAIGKVDRSALARLAREELSTRAGERGPR